MGKAEDAGSCVAALPNLVGRRIRADILYTYAGFRVVQYEVIKQEVGIRPDDTVGAVPARPGKVHALMEDPRNPNFRVWAVVLYPEQFARRRRRRLLEV